VQGQSTSHPTSFAQKGAEAALKLKEEEIRRMVEAFAKRASTLCEALKGVPGIEFIPPQGAFYLFAKVSGYFGKKAKEGRLIQNSLDFAEYLLDEAKVAVVPGIAFGEDEFIRISYATSEENLLIAVERIKVALAKLS